MNLFMTVASVAMVYTVGGDCRLGEPPRVLPEGRFLFPSASLVIYEVLAC